MSENVGMSGGRPGKRMGVACERGQGCRQAEDRQRRHTPGEELAHTCYCSTRAGARSYTHLLLIDLSFGFDHHELLTAHVGLCRSRLSPASPNHVPRKKRALLGSLLSNREPGRVSTAAGCEAVDGSRDPSTSREGRQARGSADSHAREGRHASASTGEQGAGGA